MLNVSSLSTSKLPVYSIVRGSSSPLTSSGLPNLVSDTIASDANASSLSLLNGLDALAAQGLYCIDGSATKILKKPPFAPSNINLFTPKLYAGASEMAPAAANNKTEAQIKSDLKATLTKRFGKNTSQINKGMAVYNDPTIKTLVPDPRLRSAVASLYGTDNESVITSLKNGEFKGVEFADLPAGMNPTTVAFSGTKTGDTKPTIVFNKTYQYEDPRLLGSIASHEILHSDATNSEKEELIATVMDTAAYAQLVKEDPALASKNTELTRRMNTKLMAMVNTRDTNGKIRLLTSQGNVYPGGTTPLANFAAAFPGVLTAADTAGNAQLNAMLSKITGKKVTNANFDTNTLNLLDTKLNNAFSPKDWVSIASALKLKTK